MKPTLLLIYLVLNAVFITAQRANTWYFGSNAGLNFSTTVPTPLLNGVANTPDNISTISNSAGNLLFYTDGSTVWNKNHVIMSNGSGLIGDFSAGQCALIVPVPCDTNKYVIWQPTEFSSPGQLHYSVVDMSLSGGLGAVVSSQKNVSLGTGWTEKLCAYYEPSLNQYWVLTHKWNSNQFVAFSVSANSIASQTIISAVGSIHNCGTYSGAHDAMGQLTISQNGKKVINALTCQDKYELFDFNSITGVVSNPITIPSQGGYAWGTAFSPDSKKLYVNSIFGQKILQYDISSNSSSVILSSQYTVTTVNTSGYIFGYMELGPDNKIYTARPGNSSLSVISNPNVSGTGCNFFLAGQSLGGKSSTHGLSRIAYGIPPNYVQSGALTVSASPSIICQGASSTLTAAGGLGYTWSNFNTGPVIIVSPSSTTSYSVNGTTNTACSLAGSVSVVVMPAPSLSVAGGTSVCAGQTLVLNAVGATSYQWGSGQTTSTLSIAPVSTTTYTVSGSNTLGCSSSYSHLVYLLPRPAVSIIGNTTVCFGQSTILTATGGANYQWSTGAATSSIVVYPLGNTSYSVTGTSMNSSCVGSASVALSIIECMGLEEKGGIGPSIRVYPNPFNNELVLVSNQINDEKLELRILNSLGSSVYFVTCENQQAGVPSKVEGLGELEPGLYQLQCKTKSAVLTLKLVKSPN